MFKNIEFEKETKCDSVSWDFSFLMKATNFFLKLSSKS
ncbi:hypothetical protein GLIP_2390 [Aliiglaciecola lipolytica E3]|uniref:Uncharacterized protein n=1 Tax=Aliiglaciecola lipolytica E3 TaxID=1127673 RepID=K6XTK6_9ALTE|nr:hypothetical protein GLIP_2390 [Aliiglaciecola lipolytica E3]